MQEILIFFLKKINNRSIYTELSINGFYLKTVKDGSNVRRVSRFNNRHFPQCCLKQHLVKIALKSCIFALKQRSGECNYI